MLAEPSELLFVRRKAAALLGGIPTINRSAGREDIDEPELGVDVRQRGAQGRAGVRRRGDLLSCYVVFTSTPSRLAAATMAARKPSHQCPYGRQAPAGEQVEQPARNRQSPPICHQLLVERRDVRDDSDDHDIVRMACPRGALGGRRGLFTGEDAVWVMLNSRS